MSVFVGKSCRCILVRRVTPVELWSREEGRMEDFYKMKDKIQYHFQSGSKRRPFSSGSYEVKDIGEKKKILISSEASDEYKAS